MTRKDFVAIAEAIAKGYCFYDREYEKELIVLVAKDIADVCQRSNQNFDRERFLRACRGQS